MADSVSEDAFAAKPVSGRKRRRLTISNLARGDLLAGRYAIISFLGRGANGTVVLCKDQLLGGLNVAVKLVPERIRINAIDAARFSREVRAGFKVKHCNLVSLYDLIRHDSLLGYSMEAVSGTTLQEFLDHKGKMPQFRFTGLFLQMAEGLATLHAHGILHRDLKPANILLSNDGQVKITDYGMAQFFECEEVRTSGSEDELKLSTGKRLTLKGNIAGTPHYLSPEYVEFGKVDARHELYALGVIAYELVGGELPFPGRSIIEQLCNRVTLAPRPLKEICPEADSNLAAIIMQLLERDPSSRIQSARDLVNRIKRLAVAPQRSGADRQSDEVCEGFFGKMKTFVLVQLVQAWATLRFTYEVTYGCLVEGRRVALISGDASSAMSRLVRRVVDFWDEASPLTLFLVFALAGSVAGGAGFMLRNTPQPTVEPALQIEVVPGAGVGSPHVAEPVPKPRARFFAPLQSRAKVVRNLPPATPQTAKLKKAPSAKKIKR